MKNSNSLIVVILCIVSGMLLSGCGTPKPTTVSTTTTPLMKDVVIPRQDIEIPRTQITKLPLLKEDLEMASPEVPATLENVDVSPDPAYGRSVENPIKLGSVGKGRCIANINSYIKALKEASGKEYDYELDRSIGEVYEEEHIDIINLFIPSSKDSTLLYFQGNTPGEFYFPYGIVLDTDASETVTYVADTKTAPDEYGDDLNYYSAIPDFDINNSPISIWFLKDGPNYDGFIIGGHAEAKVCEVASLEVFSKMAEFDPEGTGVFSFGVGYHRRSTSFPVARYNQLIGEMLEAFSDLEKEFPFQVSVNEIEADQFNRYTNMLTEHVTNAKKYSEWDTHVVEYKLLNHPLMIPFRKVSDGQIIQFDVPVEKFGEIPTELAYSSMDKDLMAVEEDLGKNIDYNQAQIVNIRGLVVTSEKYLWRLDWAATDKSSISVENEMLVGHDPPPDGFTITDEYGTRPITLQGAINTMNDPSVVIEDDVRKLLNDWKNNADDFLKGFAERKSTLIETIKQDTRSLMDFKAKVSQRREDLQNRKFDGHVIDAFLRGWVFGIGSDELDDQLDAWYAGRRANVWRYIMDENPKLKEDGKLAGIFQVDDIFFGVKNRGNVISVTPYKLTGGEFLQVIDKVRDVSYAVSPFNYRFKSLEEK